VHRGRGIESGRKIETLTENNTDSRHTVVHRGRETESDMMIETLTGKIEIVDRHSYMGIDWNKDRRMDRKIRYSR
jgi:hypothetical protein